MTVGAAILALTTLPVFAAEHDFATVGGYGPYQTGEGGEFTFGLVPGDTVMNNIVNAYYSGAKDVVTGTGSQNFQTFCMSDISIYGSQSYSFVISQHNGFNFPLTQGAAWLYNQFATGGSFGGWAAYDYANTTAAGRANGAGSSADLLQKAIWSFMGNVAGLAPEDLTNPFEVAAAKEFGGGVASDATWQLANQAAGANNFNVYVMNVFNPGSAYSWPDFQDEPIYIADGLELPNQIPDAGSTCWLFGIGLTGLALAATRLRR